MALVIRKDLWSTAELFFSVCCYGFLLNIIHSQKFLSIKTYAMTILTRNFVILYQSRDRRLDLYFLLLFRSRWIFRFSFTINMSWPATETTKLYYDTMYLPVRLISAPWGTTKTDKCYRLSFDLFTAAVDRDGRPRTKKTSGRLLAIQTFRSVHRK